MIEKQLQIKTKEAEVFQKELSNQKSENQKLREKVRDLLKTRSTVAPTQAIDDSQIQAELKFYKQKYESIQ